MSGRRRVSLLDSLEEIAEELQEYDYDDNSDDDSLDADDTFEESSNPESTNNDTIVDMGYEDPESLSKLQTAHKRVSFQGRRTSTESELSGGTSISAPQSSSNLRENVVQRRVTIHGRSRRGETLYGRPSVSDASSASPEPSPTPRRNFVFSMFMGRRKPKTDQNFDTMAEAVNKLNASAVNEFEHVAAAAAVVAASSTPNTRRGYIQFGQGDYVLVMLTLLDMADHDGDKDLYTVDPVNRHGYPAGEGKTDHQKQGPYLFVLCVVTQVLFDEHQRYYTVRRCDTETEQRADPGFMEPIRTPEAIEVAWAAARRSKRSLSENTGPEIDQQNLLQRAASNIQNYWLNIAGTAMPFYRNTRNTTKVYVRHVLHGDDGYSFNLHFSGVNLLALCSLIFLFIDIVQYAFLPARFDKPAAILGLVVWIILALELVFEFLVRPTNYRELISTDKAFSPSTARNINGLHLVLEAGALILYIPSSAICFDLTNWCGDRHTFFDRIEATKWALSSSDHWKVVAGRLALSLTFLRAFGLVRHWKQMFISHAYNGTENPSLVRSLFMIEDKNLFRRNKKDDEFYPLVQERNSARNPSGTGPLDEDQQLKNAANIGTALMQLNSDRAFMILLLLVCVFPSLFSLSHHNPVALKSVQMLQDNNVAVLSNSSDDCEYLENTVQSWLLGASVSHIKVHQHAIGSCFVLWAELHPVRCKWQQESGVITSCTAATAIVPTSICECWDRIAPDSSGQASREYFAESANLRKSEITEIFITTDESIALVNGTRADFHVRVFYDESNSTAMAHFSLLLLLSSLLLLGLFGLTAIRWDTERLVLSPLQRMLMIVVRYAENPLSTPALRKRGGNDNEVMLGNFETEQLTKSIAKIADLLRKCWGVAGAGIISSNLARTKTGGTVVFNPTIPGKQVYALFGFVSISDFGKQLRALDKDIMILINDVARVVHDEVYRWGLGNSGQCNKNLGSSFLMVFRIGDFSEVHDRKKRATDVVFNSQIRNVRVKSPEGHSRKRRTSSKYYDRGGGATLQLASLPGIQAFADRALLGFLKSFAGLHRDQNMQNWQKDFRLGAGVGNYKIRVIYGMDAGWGVEGAVGSEYKIDATYLSPHVNMASRMMSACKLYGVTVLLSQAVEELLSKPARLKLRHLDTVYVKGSNVAQRIYTYDARYEGVDFFLFEKLPDQADFEADVYVPSIWDTDQDLRSMRQHVTDEFKETFDKGVQEYLEGNWKEAIAILSEADNIMFEAVVDQGYVDYITEDLAEYGKTLTHSTEELAQLKEEYGDRPSKCLIQFMKRRKGKAPPDWHGVHHLMSK